MQAEADGIYLMRAKALPVVRSIKERIDDIARGAALMTGTKVEIEFIKEDLGLSLVVNPELAAAEEIARLLKFPSAIEIDTFAKGRVELLKFEVTKESPLCGMQLKYMSKKLDCNVLVCTVERGSETMIPNGDFTMWEGDKISFIASGKKAAQFFKAAKMNTGRVRSAMIVGGGMICIYLANILLSSGMEVKIIEKDSRICELLAERLPEAIIINGDGADKTLMEEEGILNAGYLSLRFSNVCHPHLRTEGS